MRRLLLALLMVLPLPVQAIGEDPPLPRQRPADLGTPAVPLPRERPAETQPVTAPAATPTPPAAPTEPTTPETPLPQSKAPPQEPAPPAEPRIYQTACPALLNGLVEAKPLPPIHDGQCGEQSPLSVTAVFANGREIPFNAAATLDCNMASALPGWLADVDTYLRAHENTSIASVIVSTSYMCRNVDNAKEGNLSFHAFADALDVIGFKLEDGRQVMLEQAWRGTEEQGHDLWHFAHDAACGHFMTVLGPDADSFHQNNMHLDLGCHGKTCTARLCQ